MKKILMSVLALLVTAMMIVSFAACGGNDDAEETTTAAPADESVADTVEDEVTDAPEDDATDAVDAPVDETEADVEGETVEGETEADTTVAEGESEGETEAVVVPTEKADIVALYNEATVKASKAAFKKTTVTELRNLEMGALGKIDLVRETVGDFLGEGTNTVNVAKGKGASELVAGKLTAADVTAATCKLSADGKYYEVTLTVKNEKNPRKNSSALSRFTTDFKDNVEMKEGLLEAEAGVDTVDCTVTTAKIVAKIAVADNTVTALDYTISTDAYLTNVKYTIAKVKVVTGTIYTTVKYSGFSY